jgi:DNA-binding phage protein
MKDRLHDDAMAELFLEDPRFAVGYLSEQLRDGEQADFLIALRQFVQAHGGVQTVAEKAGLNSSQLDEMLSARGDPTMRVLRAVLQTVGLKLKVEKTVD